MGEIRARELVRMAIDHGFTYSHTSGSHMIYIKGGNHVSIPGPENRMVAPGTARNCVKKIKGA